MFRKIMKLAGIGFVSGMIAGNLISWFCGGCGSEIVGQKLVDMTGSVSAAILVQTFFSGLLGAIAMGGTIVYDEENERLPLLVGTLAHCLSILASYSVISLWLGWARDFSELLVINGSQIVGFAIIWTVMYLRYKAQVRRLNELLEKSRNEEDEAKQE